MEALAHWLRKRVRVVVRCALFGTIYGMACGGIYGAVVGVVIGAPFGAFYGAIGGCVFGVLGGLIGGPAGWRLAGLVGGLVAALAVLHPGGWNHGGLAMMPTWFYVLPSVIGGSVGTGIGVGLRRGASPLPGVTHFAETVRAIETEPLPPRLPRPTWPSELTPAAAPEGRGDEPSPANG
jgi:hypothetical protein